MRNKRQIQKDKVAAVEIPTHTKRDDSDFRRFFRSGVNLLWSLNDRNDHDGGLRTAKPEVVDDDGNANERRNTIKVPKSSRLEEKLKTKSRSKRFCIQKCRTGSDLGEEYY
jgi:hypothetical protein